MTWPAPYAEPPAPPVELSAEEQALEDARDAEAAEIEALKIERWSVG